MSCRNLLRNRRRTTITLLGLVVGLTAVNIFQGYTKDALEGLRDAAIKGEMLGHVILFKKDALTLGKLNEDAYLFTGDEIATIQQKLAGLDAIEFTAPKLNISGLITNGEASLIFFGVGIDPAQYRRFRQSFIYQGSGTQLSPERPIGGQIAEGLAQILKLKVGDLAVLFSVTVKSRMNAVDVLVSGLYNTGTVATNDKYVLVPLSLARKLYDTDGAHEISILLRKDADEARARQLIRDRLADTGLKLDVYSWQERSSFYTSVSQLYDMIFGFLFLIVLIVAGMGMLNTMTMAVMERIPEIGVLRALGMRRAGVYRLFMAEGFLLGALGSILAALVTILISSLINGLAITYVPPSLSDAVRLNVEMDFTLIGANGLAIAILSSLVSFFPARYAARRDIAAALQHA